MKTIGNKKPGVSDIEGLELQPCDSLRKVVVICGEEGILCWTVESILKTRVGWRVVRTDPRAGFAGLLCDVRENRAESVILYHFDAVRNARMALDLVREVPDLKVITVSPDDNEMQVYSRQLVCMHQTADLISALED